MKKPPARVAFVIANHHNRFCSVLPFPDQLEDEASSAVGDGDVAGGTASDAIACAIEVIEPLPRPAE